MQSRETVRVMGRYVSELLHCSQCGYVCLPNPCWLDEAYSSAIASTDTGIVARNLATAEQLAILLYFGFGERGGGRYLDLAGGSGLLVRLMRDQGFDFRWSDKYAQNMLSAGFEWPTDEDVACVAVTAMEVLEHVTDPLGFISEALVTGGSDTLIFSTSVYEGGPPAVDAWPYYSLQTGQHISFFTYRTLGQIGKQLSLKYVGHGDLHILTRRTIVPSSPLLRLAAARTRKLLLPFVRNGIKGRMIADHEAMIQRLKQLQTGEPT